MARQTIGTRSFTVIEGGALAASRRRKRMRAFMECAVEAGVYACSYLFLFAVAWAVQCVLEGRLAPLGFFGAVGALFACALLDCPISGAATGAAWAVGDRLEGALDAADQLAGRLRHHGRRRRPEP